MKRILLATVLCVACGKATPPPATPTPKPTQPAAHRPPPGARAAAAIAVIPVPVSLQLLEGDSFRLATNSIIVANGAEPTRIGNFLAQLIGNTRESTPRVVTAPDTTQSVIELILDPGLNTGAEGYEVMVAKERVQIKAATAAGLFYGAQTFRQLLPYSVEYTAALPRAMKVPAVRVVDSPRYEWRGLMLDVSRHFLKLDDVKAIVDEMALYKLNRLHLTLSNDQGWRIEIPTWPNLALYGGSTQVGGGPGGYYTQAQYSELVRYAQERFITIVPEIDMPGHINAAMASYPELNCDGVAPALYTGTSVGFSNFCVEKDITYKFVDDVVASIASITTGPYFHMGGDEVKRLGRPAYNQFVERVEKIVQSRGKRMIGWSEVAPANLSGNTIVQSWIPDSAHLAVARGSKVILSPANKIYLDMQYDQQTPIGLHWAAYVELWNAYDWEPSTLNPKLPAESILGLEAPIWSETLGKRADFEYMMFPRLTAVAELAWSPQGAHNWMDYTARVLAHERRWNALGINYRRFNSDLTL